MLGSAERWRWWVCGIAACVCCGCGDSGPPRPRADWEVVSQIREGFGADSETDQEGGTTEEVQPTGFATLRGTFRLSGEAPSPTALNVNKDVEVCAPGGKTVYAQDLVVDSATGGIANVVLFADSVPDAWLHESARSVAADAVDFDQKQCVFLTHVVALQVGQKLRVLNSDPVGHNLMVGTFNQTIPSGGEAVYEPLKEDRMPIEMRCSIHPWMQAWMLTRENGYFAVTAPDGSFEIPNLPAGVPVELRVWQEKIGPVQEVTVDGQSTKWSKGRLELVLEPDSEKILDVVIDAATLQR